MVNNKRKEYKKYLMKHFPNDCKGDCNICFYKRYENCKKHIEDLANYSISLDRKKTMKDIEKEYKIDLNGIDTLPLSDR